MDAIQTALKHIQYLSVQIGGRGSCTPAVRRAAEYIQAELRSLGVKETALEPFRGSPTTYRPYFLAFAAALTGTLISVLLGGRIAFSVGAALNLLGVWAMLAESDFRWHWARLLTPQVTTQNLTGIIPPSQRVERRVVLCAHLDTHRTPIFYASPAWQRLFGQLVGGALVSMAAGGLVFLLFALTGWEGSRWVGIFFALIQAVVLALLGSADFTPYNPGANDNASGVGVIMSLVGRLTENPLQRTEVRLLFTDCEETGAGGITAYLDQHAHRLGADTVYLMLDEVGVGRIKHLSNDGMIVKHPTHPRALELARQASGVIKRGVFEMPGLAYTDAVPVTKRGLPAITVSTHLPKESAHRNHWHQMSDRVEYIDHQTLQDAHDFTWRVLNLIDNQV